MQSLIMFERLIKAINRRNIEFEFQAKASIQTIKNNRLSDDKLTQEILSRYPMSIILLFDYSTIKLRIKIILDTNMKIDDSYKDY